MYVCLVVVFGLFLRLWLNFRVFVSWRGVGRCCGCLMMFLLAECHSSSIFSSSQVCSSWLYALSMMSKCVPDCIALVVALIRAVV